jgi:hypothetical protein
MSDNRSPQPDPEFDGDSTHPDLLLTPLPPPGQIGPESTVCVEAQAAGVTVKTQDGSNPCDPTVKQGRGIPRDVA